MEPNRKTNNNALIGTMVLLALIAVAVYILFANENNNDAEPNDVVTTEETPQEELIAARADVGVVLSAIQADINAGTNVANNELSQTLSSERRELREAYKNVTGEARAEYEEIDRGLGRLETELKGDVKVATVTIGALMSNLEADMESGARATWNEIKERTAAAMEAIDDDTADVEVTATTSAEVE